MGEEFLDHNAFVTQQPVHLLDCVLAELAQCLRQALSDGMDGQRRSPVLYIRVRITAGSTKNKDLKRATTSDQIGVERLQLIRRMAVARHKCIGIRQTSTTLLPKAESERLAHECGALRRRRKVDASAMMWTVLLGLGTGRERTLAGLRRTDERVTGKSLAPSSFDDRFSTELARMFRAVLREVMTNLAASEVRYGGVLEGFRDVLVADATVVKLHRLLARRFPGTRKSSSPAAAKLHRVMSASGTGAHKVKVTGERANEPRTLQMGPWVEGRLLLFELSYFRYQFFDAIDRNGGYFITRLAANADPCIVATHRQWRGRSIELVGQRLREVAGR